MSEKELEEYLNLSTEAKYEKHKAWYFTKYPESNLYRFHKSQIVHFKREMLKYENKQTVDPLETEIYIAECELLEYVLNLSNVPQQAEQPYFKNNFDSTPAIEVYRHFKGGLFDKGFLTEIELADYLKAAFEMKTAPEVRFKLKNIRTKKNIEAVFYNYYKNVAGKIHGTQKKYAALLGDYFEGYKTDTVSTNFAKSNY
jgi:hypothetical protein